MKNIKERAGSERLTTSHLAESEGEIGKDKERGGGRERSRKRWRKTKRRNKKI